MFVKEEKEGEEENGNSKELLYQNEVRWHKRKILGNGENFKDNCCEVDASGMR